MKSIFFIFSLVFNNYLGAGAKVLKDKQLTAQQLEKATQKLHFIISDDSCMAECEIKKAHDLLSKDPLFQQIGVPCTSALYAVLAYRYRGLGLTIKMGLFEYAQYKPEKRAAAAEKQFVLAHHYAENALKTAAQAAAPDQLTTFIQQQKQRAIKPGCATRHEVIMVDPETYKEKIPVQLNEQVQKPRWCLCSWLCKRRKKA